MTDMPPSLRKEQQILERFMWLSIAISVATIVLKMVAAWVTGSVGFLSDAIETVINFVAAVVGLWALKLSAKPADKNHNFGHSKAEYFSAQVEGSLILVAAVAIIYTSIDRLLNPQPLEQLGIGLLFSVAAALLNAAAGYALVRAGKRYRSITLEADGKHLLTDVLTTVGVIVGMALVALTGWEILDPIVALLVGANILLTGYKLLRSAILSLLAEALPDEELAKLNDFLDDFAAENGVAFTSVRTAAFGRERLISLVMQVPGEWTVSYAHAHADEIEAGVANALGAAETIVHVEPMGYTTRTGPLFGESLTNPR
ncbi:cation diffusion facilitator family transporter [Corynebacterium sp. p3-SID1056]|uniref:cation diffusion facilitator family transporter n=1 Tax=Corynebacterium sp. p3-SID1056 TaxID=2916092 RepID=UPI0021A2D7C4|nr:cation diffusion facilitator family transporter [Corynebacterium sp. p3-SID1056]MCT2338379.1 cation diffusion facilitator family transporter [Corynebacterium sp. p3-SID1056]